MHLSTLALRRAAQILGEGKERDLEIRISFDEEERTVTIKDSGECDVAWRQMSLTAPRT